MDQNYTNKDREKITMCNVVLNNEFNGVELYFDEKPVKNILDSLKSNKFRWHKVKKCWYAKQNKKNLSIAEQFKNNEVPEQNNEKIVKTKNTKQNKNISLWNRVQFTKGTADISQYDYKFVGSNYTGLSVKETSSTIRKHLKSRFTEVKFSITSDYNKIYVEIKKSPYKKDSKELEAIMSYCKEILNSYNFDDSDVYTDYFCCHYYNSLYIDCDYEQIDQTEEQQSDILNFRNKLIEKAEEEKRKKEMKEQQQQKQREEEEKQYLLRLEEEKKEIKYIYNSIEVKQLKDQQQYFIINSDFANSNKNNTLDQYKEEVKKGDCYKQNVKITKEIYFNSKKSLDYFSNLLLNDFIFLKNTGGSYTDDNRINSMTDYYNMTKEEQNTVEWNLQGVAIYHNNELQFVIDSQGHSYARYVGLIDNATIQKDYVTEQILNDEQLQELKYQADVLTDISTTVISNNNIINSWNNENGEQYKGLMKEQLKINNIKLSEPIIRQLPEDMEELKKAMYELLIEVNGIQEQFKNAKFIEGQKLTIFNINDFGMMSESKITYKDHKYKSYAQSKNAVKLIFRPQNKRKDHYQYYYSDMLVYDGWLELQKTVLHDIEHKNNMTITKTKYLSFDKKMYDRVLEHFKTKGIEPIINTYKTIF